MAIILLAILTNKKSKKAAFKEILIPIITMTILIIIFILNQLATQKFYYFMNMCIFSIKNFGKQNLNCNYIALVYFVIFTIFAMIFTKIAYKYQNKKEKEITLIITSYAIGSILICVPIFNRYHIDAGITLFIILFIYQLKCSIYELLNDKRIKLTIKAIIIIITIILSIKTIYITKKYRKTIQVQGIYYGAIIDNNIQKNIDNMNEFIRNNKNKDIILLSEYSMMYSEDYTINNGFFDLPLKGNLGKNDQNNLIDEIKKHDNPTILVENKEKSEYEIYQFTDDVRKYVEENYQKIGEIENYDIYTLKT